MAEPLTVVVGTSNGGIATAQALRRADYTGRIVLLGEETAWPYDKPPLSKAFLAGTSSETEISLLSEADIAALGIELRLGCRATAVDPAANTVEIHTGERVRFDHLVVATGARARPSPWGHPTDTHLLRTLDDARRLHSTLQTGGRLVVIGGGFIGSEVAATARSAGLDVTIIDPVSALMETALGSDIGTLFSELHERQGVSVLLGVGVQDVTRGQGGLQVHLSDGRIIAADSVVVGIGAVPNDEWLRSSGLHVDDGIVCDQYCRAVECQNVYAVGDVARWHNPRYGRLCRIEHWTNATEQATAVAHNITNPAEPKPYTPVEYVWSDQYDWKLRIAGHTGPYCRVEIVGDTAAGRFAGLYGTDDRPLSGIAVVNWPRALVAGRKALQLGSSYPALKQTLEQLAVDQLSPPAGVGS